MTRNGFMKLVKGKGKFYKDLETMNDGWYNPEYYNNNLQLVYENAEGTVMSYMNIGPKYSKGSPLPGEYRVSYITKSNDDKQLSERETFFDIDQDDLNTLMNKYELSFGY